MSYRTGNFPPYRTCPGGYRGYSFVAPGLLRKYRISRLDRLSEQKLLSFSEIDLKLWMNVLRDLSAEILMPSSPHLRSISEKERSFCSSVGPGLGYLYFRQAARAQTKGITSISAGAGSVWREVSGPI